MAASKWIRKDSNGPPDTLISEQSEKEIIEEKQYALLETAEVIEIEIDKTIYTKRPSLMIGLKSLLGSII